METAKNKALKWLEAKNLDEFSRKEINSLLENQEEIEEALSISKLNINKSAGNTYKSMQKCVQMH